MMNDTAEERLAGMLKKKVSIEKVLVSNANKSTPILPVWKKSENDDSQTHSKKTTTNKLLKQQPHVQQLKTAVPIRDSKLFAQSASFQAFKLPKIKTAPQSTNCDQEGFEEWLRQCRAASMRKLKTKKKQNNTGSSKAVQGKPTNLANVRMVLQDEETSKSTMKVGEYFGRAWKYLDPIGLNLRKVEEEFRICQEFATIHESVWFRLQAVSYLLNVGFNDLARPVLAKSRESFGTILQLTETGQLTENSIDPLFRWPKAIIRRCGILVLAKFLQEYQSREDFLRRWMVREGMIVAILRAYLFGTKASRLFVQRYQFIDKGTKRIAGILLRQFVTEEELMRTQSFCRKQVLLRIPQDSKTAFLKMDRFITKELERRTLDSKRASTHVQNAQLCRDLQRNTTISMEVRLRAATFEICERQCISGLMQESNLSYQFPSVTGLEKRLGVPCYYDRWITLQEETQPDGQELDELEQLLQEIHDDEDYVDDFKDGAENETSEEKAERLANERAAKAAELMKQTRKARENAMSDFQIQKTVKEVLFGIVDHLELVDIATEFVYDSLLLIHVDQGIDIVEEGNRIHQMQVVEGERMTLEDELSSAVRQAEIEARERDRQGMLDEDKPGLRKRLKRMTKAEKREYQLKEMEYQRRCTQRESRAQLMKAQAEQVQMQIEDRLARRLRKALREQHQQQQCSAAEEQYQQQEYPTGEQYQTTEQGYEEIPAEENYHVTEQGYEKYREEYKTIERGYEEDQPHYENYDAEEWVEYFDDDGYPYYYNNFTGVSQYEYPF